MTNDSHPLETIGESSQHSTPCMEDMSAEVNFDCMGLQLSSDVKSKSNQNAIGDDDDHDGNEDSVLVSPSVEPNLDEEFGEEADDCDLVALPGTNGRNSPATEDAEDPWLKNILSKGAAKREPKSNARKSQKNRKDELLNIHSETQRMIRESRVHLPYHNPEKKSLSSVLEGIRQKRESYGIGSRRSSVFEVPRSSRLVRNANANPPGKNSERVSVARAPDLPEPLGEKLAACKKLDFEVDDDEESQEYEDLMTRLMKKKEKEMMQSDPMIDLSSVAAEGISEEPVKTASLGPTQEKLGDDHVMAQSVPNPEYEMAAVSDIQDESLAPGHPPKDDGDKKSKIRELLDRHVDPKRVPKLGRKPCGEDELIIEEEPKGVEKLFMRLEKELERKKKQTTSIELSTSSKLTVDGVESLQVKKVVYNMDEKTEIKKTSRDRLKEVLRSQMMESRQERLLERYRAYEALGRDRGASRLAEDYPALPDEEEDDDDFGSSGSDSSHEVEPEEEEEEDEEEAAVVRQEQANPFIDDEADVDDDDDDDDNGCIVEGTDDDDDDDDDDEKVTKEVQLIDDDDDTIQPIRRWTAKIIDDDEEEDGDADSTSMGSERKEVGGEHRRQSVNLFDEDAMSCQGPEQEIKVPQRPFGVVSSTLDDHLSNDVSLSSRVRQDRDIARLSSSSPTNHNNPSSSMTNDVSSSLTTLDNCKLNRSKGADAVEDLSQPMSHHSSNRMVSQDVTSSFPASVLYPDWLLADSVNNDVKATDVGRVVQGLCSTPQENNEELLMFCSGSFVTQKDEPGFPNSVTSSGDGFKSRKRRRDEEDDLGLESNDDRNDDDDDDDDDKEDDDDDLENKYQPMRKKGKINDEFVEKEAELSGSEDDDDDDDDEEGLGAEDEMEEEEGDADDVGTEEDLRKQVHRVHLKKLLDQDKRDIRLLQEHLLEDGDLHDDLGLGRLRRFRWNNLNVAGDDDGVAGEGSEDEGIKEGEDDAKWRMMRLEREKFLQKIQEKEKDEDSDRNNSQTPFSRQMKLKLVSSFVQDSTTPNQSKGIPKANSVTPLMKTPKVLSKSTGPKPVGSFLARSKETLAKFSDPSKAGGPTFNNSTATLVSRNSRNFVFAHLSPSKKESMRKDENMVSKGSTQPRKKPQARDETPIPQSRILKFLNE